MAEADTAELATAAKKYWSDEGYSEGGIIREVDYAPQSGGLDPMFAGIRIVDCDTHITEAPDLFTSRAPAALKSRMPRVERIDGLGKWMVSGRLDRHPGLKIGLIESGMGWVPFAIEALEHQFDEMLASKARELSRRPWQYFRDHFWCTYWFETVAPQLLLETIGVDNVLFETDFPHPASLYPGVQEHLRDTLGGHSREVQKKVLQDNAVKLYNLPF